LNENWPAKYQKLLHLVIEDLDDLESGITARELTEDQTWTVHALLEDARS
jgi:hypothetical protein